MVFGSGAGKRTFKTLRKLILTNLAREQKTINQIANDTHSNWKTVDNHITYLIGKGFAREVFASSYVKIVEITDRGKQHLKKRTV